MGSETQGPATERPVGDIANASSGRRGVHSMMASYDGRSNSVSSEQSRDRGDVILPSRVDHDAKNDGILVVADLPLGEGAAVALGSDQSV